MTAALAHHQVRVCGNCAEQLIELLYGRGRVSSLIAGVSVARLSTESLGNLCQGESTTLTLALKKQTDHWTEIRGTDLESSPAL